MTVQQLPIQQQPTEQFARVCRWHPTPVLTEVGLFYCFSMTTTTADQGGNTSEWREGAFEWMLAHYARQHRILLVCTAQPQARLMQQRLQVLPDPPLDVRLIPDVEYLPYDHYSPARQGVAQRLKALAGLAASFPDIAIVSPANLLHRLPPRARLRSWGMHCAVGEKFDRQAWVDHLAENAYYHVEQVDEPGSFAVRGDIVDIFVYGHEHPWRIDTLDDQIVGLYAYHPTSGQTVRTMDKIDISPSSLAPLDSASLDRFAREFRRLGSFDAQQAEQNSVYRTVLNRRPAQGIESYFPLFYEHSSSIADLLDPQARVFLLPGVKHTLEHYLRFSNNRYQAALNDPDHPPVPPERLLLTERELRAWLKSVDARDLDSARQQKRLQQDAGLHLSQAPPLALDPMSDQVDLLNFVKRRKLRCIVCSSSRGRLNFQLDLLEQRRPAAVGQPDGFGQALKADDDLQIVIAPLEHSFIDQGANLLIVGESVFGSISRRAAGKTVVDELTRHGALLNNLDDLTKGDPIIHPEHGVGRFDGVVRLNVNDADAELVLLRYADGDKLYVPVDQVHLLDRYHLNEGEENAPWHSLASSAWRKRVRRARAGMDDLAGRIIAIHAARKKSAAVKYQIDKVQYQDFCSQFPYQETPDQRLAIEAVLQDMQQGRIIDRLVVGEVGSGKTEVALRAVFVCAMNQRQSVVLTPTTVLCQQHYERFRERLSQWQIRVEIMSRFNRDRHAQVMAEVARGEIAVLIATHGALSDKMRFHALGLLVIDEEQRFGVAQKEKLKNVTAQLNVLKLSATPIPRTLQMALHGLSDLSIIATLPPTRQRTDTEIIQWDDQKIRRYCERELFRGGQIFVVNPRIRSLARLRDRLQDLLPDARIAMIHGRSPVEEIEQAMLDFYHQHSDILVSTSIIENGIDFPSANTIIVNDATAFGLASLHQLRGRVGRSHIKAYALLVVPPEAIHTASAKDRLATISQATADGHSFQLALSDLEARGGGSPLTHRQTGHEMKVGYSTYIGELARTLREHGSSLHEIFGLYQPQTVEVHSSAAAALPDKYIPSVSERLRYYRAIHYANDQGSLFDLRAQLFERFGSLPPPVDNLFIIAELKQKCQQAGATSVKCSTRFTRIKFSDHHQIDLDKLLAWVARHKTRLTVGTDNLMEIRHRQPPDEASALQDQERATAQLILTHQILDYLCTNPSMTDTGTHWRVIRRPSGDDPIDEDLWLKTYDL